MLSLCSFVFVEFYASALDVPAKCTPPRMRSAAGCGCILRVMALLTLLPCSAPASTAPTRLPLPAPSAANLPPAPRYHRRGAPAMRLRGGTAGESGDDRGSSAAVHVPPALVMNGTTMTGDEQPQRAEQPRRGLEVDMEGEVGPHGIRIRQAKLVDCMPTVMRGCRPGRDSFVSLLACIPSCADAHLRMHDSSPRWLNVPRPWTCAERRCTHSTHQSALPS